MLGDVDLKNIAHIIVELHPHIVGEAAISTLVSSLKARGYVMRSSNRKTSHLPVRPEGRPLMPAKLPLSAFIICQNEEAYLGNCIESLESCAEIVIVDSGSTDGTAALVQSYIDKGWPIRFLFEPWRGYAGQKQFALDQCREPWCLNIDSDERLDEPLQALLPSLLEAPADIVGWRIARRPYLIGYGYTPDKVRERKNLRLIRKGRGAS